MRKLGQRLFIFVVGGATRSEVCFHCLSNLLLLFQTLVLYYLTYELTTFSNLQFYVDGYCSYVLLTNFHQN
jgi:hypothetical protein